MANESPSLSEEQTSAVAHLQEIVGCSTDEAVTHLIHANWNLEAAVNNVFNPNAAPAQAPSPPPLVNDADEATMPRFRGPRVSVGTNSLEATTARPVVQANQTGLWTILSSLSELAQLPFRFAVSLIGTVLRILSKFHAVIMNICVTEIF